MDSFRAELEASGEDEVRTMLALGRYGSGRGKDKYVQHWLAEKDQEREASSKADSLEIARSAKDAAWIAADAARDAARAANNANVIATLALIAAVIAIAVSAVTAFVSGSH